MVSITTGDAIVVTIDEEILNDMCAVAKNLPECDILYESENDTIRVIAKNGKSFAVRRVLYQ